MTRNFPNPMKEIDIEFQEVQSLTQEETKEAHNKAHHN